MCGFCGIYNLDGRPVEQDLLKRMNDTMTHRGPDGSGVFIDSNIGLGHRRLAIIDLHTGDQPMSSEDGLLHVVFNGETTRTIQADVRYMLWVMDAIDQADWVVEEMGVTPSR